MPQRSSTAIRYAEAWVPVAPALLSGIELVSSLALITLLFGVIFKVLPDAVIEWRDVWFGAVITAILFIVGRYLIAFYLTYTAPASTYRITSTSAPATSRRPGATLSSGCRWVASCT